MQSSEDRTLADGLDPEKSIRDTFFQIIANNPFGVYLIDSEFKLRTVSQGAQEVFRNVARPLVGRDFDAILREIWNEPFVSEALARFRHTLATGEPFRSARTVETRADIAVVEEYDWRLERIALPDGTYGVVCYFYDLSERRKWETALLESESKFRALADAAPVLIWMSDTSGLCYWFNRTWLEFTGRPMEAELGNGWAERVHPDDFDRCLSIYTTHFERRAPFSMEYRLQRSDGEYRWLLDNGVPLFDRNGQFTGFIGSCVDITVRREAEDLLRESERRFRDMADAAPAMLWVTDPDGQCTFLSRGWYEYTGQEPSTALGLGWLGAVHPDERPTAEQEFLSANAEHRAFSLDHRVRRADGQYRWVVDAGRPRFCADGRFLGFVGSVIDMHDRRVAETKLRKSEERLRLAQAAAGMGAWEFDHQTQRAIWSPEMYPLYGLEPSASAPSIAQIGDMLHPDDQPGMIAEFEAAERRGGEFTTEYRVIRPDGKVVWLASKGYVDTDATGKPTSARGINYDITSRKESELRLKEADRRKDEFLATLAHELRNPLAPIRTGLEVMKAAPPDSPMAGEAREMMERQLSHMVRLIDDLLDVSRVSFGKVELRRARLRLAEVVELALESGRAAIEAAGHQLEVSMPRRTLWLDGDLTRLAQVLSNLLNNAARYTPSGGRVHLRALDKGDWVTLEVEDTGIGIEAGELPHVFEMFSQASTSRGRNLGGLGIGLALAKRMVDLHGGSIWARSAGQGKGSTFSVRLPLVLPPEATDDADAGGTPHGLRPLDVLVVDDNADAAKVLGLLVELFGHRARVAHSGHSAIEAVEGRRPDLVFLDIGLPDLDGYEVCRRMKPLIPQARLVALTGWGSDGDKQRSREGGFYDHLVKPVEPSAIRTLLDQLRSALD